MIFVLPFLALLGYSLTGPAENAGDQQLRLRVLDSFGDNLLWSLKISGLTLFLNVRSACRRRYAIVRYSFPGKRLLFSLLTLPLYVPGAVIGHLAAPHLQLHLPPDDVDVGPRLRDDPRHVPADAHPDRRRDEGPADRVRGGGACLGATSWQTYRKIVFPLIGPGRLAPGCSCRFIIVFNEYLVTLFVHPPGSRPRRCASST